MASDLPEVIDDFTNEPMECDACGSTNLIVEGDDYFQFLVCEDCYESIE